MDLVFSGNYHVNTMGNPTCFYITGMGGALDAGLGLALQDLSIKYSGLELSGNFLNLSVEERRRSLHEKLLKFVKGGGEKLIAVSAGATLLLREMSLHSYPGLDVLMFSPSFFGRPLDTNPSRSLKIVSGSEDWYPPEEVIEDFIDTFPVFSFDLVEGAGHFLPHSIVRENIVALNDKGPRL